MLISFLWIYSAGDGSKKKVAPMLEDNYFSSWNANTEIDVDQFKSLMVLELRK